MVPDPDDAPEDRPPADGRAVASPARVEAVADELRARGEPFVRATVVRREPPVSATVGDRAVVTADGELVGWIGGVECAQSTVRREARAVLESGEPTLVGLAPDPEAIARPGVETFELTCHSGGTIEIFLEPVTPTPRLLVVGNSPIAAALAVLAGHLAFEVTVVDPEGGAFPGAETVVTSTDPEDIAAAVAPAPYVVVASVGGYDARGVAAAVRLDAPYVGLVASEQRAREVIEAAAAGLDVDPERVHEAVTSPAGLDVGAETPEEIAASILAELVAVRRSGASSETAAPDAGDEAAEVEASAGAGEATDAGDDGFAVDPVCGMEVPTRDPAATVEHGGTTYYFCCRGCADTFEANPEDHIGTA